MMLSSRRVLKHNSVILDTENKVVIEIGDLFSAVAVEGDEEFESPPKKEEDAQSAAEKIIRQAERQAEEILSSARETASNEQGAIVQSAKAEAAKIIEEARETGYNEGIEKSTAEATAIRADAKKILDDATAERESMQKSLEPEIVNMIIGITEKLLGNTYELNPETVINIIKQGFEASAISGEVTVYVSADDFDLVEAKKDDLMALTDGSVRLTITKDLSLSPMDCVIETPFGNVDCSLGQQFESLRANLTYIMNT
ncbi:MAG: FliH/SctL family protein [Defluviitaleaceae bacterium]|nr:FliH/SctL family protein [Defluviitaleaceae bacterium]